MIIIKMYQSLVIEASLIYHLFTKDGMIGKGKDPISGLSSSIYNLKTSNQNKEKDWGKYVL